MLISWLKDRLYSTPVLLDTTCLSADSRVSSTVLLFCWTQVLISWLSDRFCSTPFFCWTQVLISWLSDRFCSTPFVAGHHVLISWLSIRFYGTPFSVLVSWLKDRHYRYSIFLLTQGQVVLYFSWKRPMIQAWRWYLFYGNYLSLWWFSTFSLKPRAHTLTQEQDGHND